MKSPAPLRTRVLFWFILGLLSVFFAEVLSGSSPFAFFVPEGYLIIFPLYTLHILVLSYIVFRWGRAVIETLFPAGMLLGMYEAYITKVLWYPPNVNFPKIGGVSLFSFPVLVLFWHPIMSFIIPVFLGENLLTSSQESFEGLHPWMATILLDRKRAKRWFVAFSILGGLVVGAQVKNILFSFLSPFLSGLFVYLFILLWRITVGMKYTMRELLPQKKGFIILLISLLILYVVLGAGMRPQYLPGLQSQVTIWLIYALIILMLALNLKVSKIKMNMIKKENIRFKAPMRWLLFGIVILSCIASLSASIRQINWLFLVSIFIAGSALGIILLSYSVTYFLTRPKSNSRAMGA